MEDAILEVMPIQSWEVEPWVMRKHYAKRMPMVMYAYGLYRGKELIGVVTYGIPPTPNLCRGICGREYESHVLELNRLVLETNEKNHASILVGRSLQMLPKPRIIVSFADTEQGHVGYVYQATNWLYTGLSARRFDPKKAEGENRHSRTLGWQKGVELIERARKHRYLFFVGNRKQIKEYKLNLKYKSQPYPKGESKRYDASAKINNQLILL